MPNGQISIVIPAYNAEDTISRAVASALAQRDVGIEVVVVDDASEDSTAGAIRRLPDPRLRLVSHEQNLGGSAARNTGARATSAEWLAFLDADDEWSPRRLAETLAVLRSADVDFALGAFEWATPERDGRVVVPSLPPDLTEAALLAAPPRGAGSTLVVRRHLFEAVGGFDEALPRHQDWDLVIRLCELSRGMIVEAPDLVRVHRTARPSYVAVLEAKAVFLKKYKDRISELPSEEQRTIYAEHELHRAQFAWYEGRVFRAMIHVLRAARIDMQTASARAIRLLI